MTEVLIDGGEGAIPVHVLDEAAATAFLSNGSPFLTRFAQQAQFKGKAGQVLIAPDKDGAPEQVLFGVAAGDRVDAMALRALPAKLPPGDYRFALLPAHLDPAQAALAWALGAYRFDRYKKAGEPAPRLAVPEGVSLAEVRSLAHASALA